ncbi:exo-alpha-sialidase, partial [Planctomycetota bacterium]
GRFRNFGDSRTGIKSGERGLECALFRAKSFDKPFEKFKSFSKQDVSCGEADVTSIEGTALHLGENGIELFISTEKDIPYPEEMHDFQKPGTGVWSIDVIQAEQSSSLKPENIRPVLSSKVPASLHIKDPVVCTSETGDTALIYCIHPFAWSSSYTGAAVRKKGEEEFSIINECILNRGPVWDVAATRITDRLRIPQIGILKKVPPLSLYFYDGAECLRPHDENKKAVSRPRGYSCEEIGGLAWGFDKDFPHMERLSVNFPLFISPYGTGCSRYISTLFTDTAMYAAWQQSQNDLSQPLVGHCLTMEQVEKILSF